YTGVPASAAYGAGIGIAIIDSGINLGNQDLMGNGLSGRANNATSRVSYSQSFIPYGTTPNDLYGHGTHVAGIITGDGTNSYGSAFYNNIHGVAPAAHLINLKVIDQNGISTDAEVIAAIDTAIVLVDDFQINQVGGGSHS